MEVKVQEETKGIGEKEIGTVSVDPTFFFSIGIQLLFSFYCIAK